MDEEVRTRLVGAALERKDAVLQLLEPSLDPDLPKGQRNLAKVVQILGFLPINVWLSETRPAEWRDRELREMANDLAASLLNVIDWLRERSGQPPHPNPASVIKAIEEHRESHFTMQRDQLATAVARGVPAEESGWKPGEIEWERWREDEHPRWFWLAHLGIWLGAGSMDVIARRSVEHSHPDHHLYFPLEMALDLAEWLDGRGQRGSQPDGPA